MKIADINDKTTSDMNEDRFQSRSPSDMDAAMVWYGKVKDLPMIKSKLHGLPYDQLDDRGQDMVHDMHVSTLARARNLDEDMIAALRQALANAATARSGGVNEARYEIHHLDQNGKTKAVQHYGDDYSDETVRKDARYLQRHNPHATIKVYKDKKPLDFKDVNEGDSIEQMTDRQLRHTVDKLGHGEVSTPDAVKYQHAKSELERRGKMDEAAMGTSAWADYLRNMLHHWQHSALVQLERTHGREAVDRVIDNYAYMVTPPEQFNERAFVDPANKTVAEYIMRSLENEMSAGRLGTITEAISLRDLEAAIISRLMITSELQVLLKQYGLDALYDAIKDTAEYHQGMDELGTSDLSIMIKQVKDHLARTSLSEDDGFSDSIRSALAASIKGDSAGAKTALQKAKQDKPNGIPMAPVNKPVGNKPKDGSFADHLQKAMDSKGKGDKASMQAHLDQATKMADIKRPNGKDERDMLAQLDESPITGDVITMELSDGRAITAHVHESRGNSIVIELDETGLSWLEETPDHSALKIGKGDARISRIANDWNKMVDALEHDTPAGWADVFKAEANGEETLALKMPYLWSRIWRQQHQNLGDSITHADEQQWIADVTSAISPSQFDEQVLPRQNLIRKKLDTKDPAMLAVYMKSAAGVRGSDVKAFAAKMSLKAGYPRDHYWQKISQLVTEYNAQHQASELHGKHAHTLSGQSSFGPTESDQYRHEAEDILHRVFRGTQTVDRIHLRDMPYGYQGSLHATLKGNEELECEQALFKAGFDVDKVTITTKDDTSITVKVYLKSKPTDDDVIEATQLKQSDLLIDPFGEESDRAETMRMMLKAKDLLPRDKQQIIDDWMQGMSFADMADKYGIPRQSAYTRLQTALSKLRRLLWVEQGRLSDRPATKPDYDDLMSKVRSEKTLTQAERDAIFHRMIGNPYRHETSAWMSAWHKLYPHSAPPDHYDLRDMVSDYMSRLRTHDKTGQRLAVPNSPRTVQNLFRLDLAKRLNMDTSYWLNKLQADQEKERNVDEAQYQGREVKLGKPIRTNTGEGGKFKVYVRDPKTGNIKMVRFGDTTGLTIKRDDPERRRNFRARHHCDNPGPRTKARYWSCRMWTRKPVGKILKGK